jgi:hypothetical protein
MSVSRWNGVREKHFEVDCQPRVMIVLSFVRGILGSAMREGDSHAGCHFERLCSSQAELDRFGFTV